MTSAMLWNYMYFALDLVVSSTIDPKRFDTRIPVGVIPSSGTRFCGRGSGPSDGDDRLLPGKLGGCVLVESAGPHLLEGFPARGTV